MGVKSGSIAALIGDEVDTPPVRTRLWSARWRGFLGYVLARSRGFAMRSSTRLVSDLVEVFVMSQIAVPALALLVGTVAVVNAFLNSLHEGVLRAHACAAREGRLFPPVVLLGVAAVLVLLPHGVLLSTVEVTPDVLILVALRVISGLVDAGVGAWTARITIVRRPYLSPWVTALPLVVALIAGGLSLESGGRSGVMGLAFSMAAARVFTQLAFLRAATRGDERPRQFQWPTRRDLARMATAVLPFAPAFALAVRLHGTRALPLLLLLPLFFKVVARPFQATELDLRSAIGRYGASGVQAVIGRVARASVGLALGCGGLAAALAAVLGAGPEVLWLIGWMAALAAGRALVALGSTIDADLRGGWLSVVAHGAQCLPLPVPAAALIQLGWAVRCARALRPSDVVAALASKQEPPAHAPALFCARYDGRGLVLQLRLHRAHRSRRAARALLDRWAAIEPAPELVALDPTTALAWWPAAEADSKQALTFALMMATPRELARVEVVSADEVRGLIGAPPTPDAGRVWRLDSAGWWVSSDGELADGPRVAVLLEAQRDGDRSLFCRGDAKVTDPITGERYAARRRGGRTVEVVQALVLMLVLVPALAQAQPLECSPEDGREAVLTRDELGRPVGLVDLRFEVPPWQRPHLACNRWLESLPAHGPVETRLLYGAEAVARLDGASRTELHQACTDAPPCRVAFPYNLHTTRGWAAQLRARLAPPVEGLCQAPVAPRVLSPRARRPLLEGLTEVEPWFTPVTRVSDELVRLVRATDGGDVFVSTMTVDAEEVARLAVELGRAQAPRVFLVFDLNTVLSESSFELFLRDLPGLYLVPYYNTPRDPRYYHIKGAASADRLVFSGANLKAYDRLPLLDLGITAKGREAAGALSAVIAGRAADACADVALLECTLSTRFGADSPWPARIRAALARSCAALPAASGDRGPFAVSDRDDLGAELIEAVGAATKAVAGTTHHLDHPELERALGRVPTRVFVGRGGSRAHPSDRISVLDTLLVEVHTKALLIDDETLLWGTGNFTRGGLGESMELLFRTQQPELLAAYRRYLHTVARLSGAAASGGAPPSDQPVLVWLTDEEQRALDAEWPGWRGALREARPGLGRFFGVASDEVRTCLRAVDGRTAIHPRADLAKCLPR